MKILTKTENRKIKELRVLYPSKPKRVAPLILISVHPSFIIIPL